MASATLPPLVVASDGRLDDSAPPSVAVLVFDPVTGTRQGVVAVLSGELLSAWGGDRETFICRVEQAAVLLGLLTWPALFASRDAYWFEDNSVVLSGLCRGGSRTALLDQGVAVVHLLLARLRARVWFEYVESHANWSDGASRLLLLGPWSAHHGFQLVTGDVPSWPWTVPPDQRVAVTLRELERRWK